MNELKKKSGWISKFYINEKLPCICHAGELNYCLLSTKQLVTKSVFVSIF